MIPWGCLSTEMPMNHLRSIRRTLRTLLLGAVCWLAAHGTTLAAGESRSKDKSFWLWSYCLVLLGIVLGILVVCRSARRRDRAKTEMFVDPKQALAGDTAESAGSGPSA